jgi:hypothetical protein
MPRAPRLQFANDMFHFLPEQNVMQMLGLK